MRNRLEENSVKFGWTFRWNCVKGNVLQVFGDTSHKTSPTSVVLRGTKLRAPNFATLALSTSSAIFQPSHLKLAPGRIHAQTHLARCM